MAVITPAMTVANTAMTNYAKTVQELIVKKLEEHLRAPLPFLTKGNYRTAKFVPGTNNTLRYLNMPDMVATTNSGTVTPGTSPWLYEGTPPTSEVLAFGYEEFSAYQAGRTLTISDLALKETDVDMMGAMSDKIAQNAIETANLYVQGILRAGTNVYRSGGGLTADVGYTDLLTGNLVKDCVARLLSANVMPFGDGTFHGIVHPFAKRDLMSDNAAGGWIDAQRYQGTVAGGLMRGELGSYGGVRFVESAIITPVTQTGANVSVTGVYTTGVFTTAAGDHGFVVGDKLLMGTVSGAGAGLVTGQTLYVLTVPSSTTFTCANTLGGALVTWGSGNLNASNIAKANSVYSTYILAPDAYVFGDWNTTEVFITAPGGHTDPLHQSALIGWKSHYGCKILGEGFYTTAEPVKYVRIESAVSLGANITMSSS